MPTFPDATNTGVPDGVTLSPSGSITVTKAGTVLDGLDIRGTVTILAPNVTIQNCKISGSGWAVVDVRASGAVIQDCEINGLSAEGIRGVSISGEDTTIRRTDIHHVEDGVYITKSGTVIEDSYIHDLDSDWSGPHYDGIAIDGGVSNIVIRHNTVINDHGQTSAVMIDNYFGAVSNVKVDNNLLSGGGYTVYSDAQFNGGAITGVSITNNHLEKGQYGYTNFVKNAPVYQGNVNDGAALVDALNQDDSAPYHPPTSGPAPVPTEPTDGGTDGTAGGPGDPSTPSNPAPSNPTTPTDPTPSNPTPSNPAPSDPAPSTPTTGGGGRPSWDGHGKFGWKWGKSSEATSKYGDLFKKGTSDVSKQAAASGTKDFTDSADRKSGASASDLSKKGSDLSSATTKLATTESSTKLSDSIASKGLLLAGTKAATDAADHHADTFDFKPSVASSGAMDDISAPGGLPELVQAIVDKGGVDASALSQLLDKIVADHDSSGAPADTPDDCGALSKLALALGHHTDLG